MLVLTAFLIVLHSMMMIPVCDAQQQDPSTLNGGSVLAMAGKDCVVVAVDKRFGSGPQMVTIAPRHIWIPPSFYEKSLAMVAFCGLEGDVQSLSQDLVSQLTFKVGRCAAMWGGGASSRISSSTRAKTITPGALASLVSHLLYQRRQAPYYAEPIVVGLKKIIATQDSIDEPLSESHDATTSSSPCYRPFLCSMDLLGAKSYSETFVVGGAATQSLYGTAQALWKPNLEPEELVEVCGKAFQSALERDCLSGYGVLILLLTKDGSITEYDLASRND
jgi:20S proteasome subunit beta 3